MKNVHNKKRKNIPIKVSVNKVALVLPLLENFSKHRFDPTPPRLHLYASKYLNIMWNITQNAYPSDIILNLSKERVRKF